MGRQLVPEENYLYTFVMPKTGAHNTYEFHGESDRGRYVMYNVEKGCVVNFSKAWFSFLATKCLLKKEKKKDVAQEKTQTKVVDVLGEKLKEKEEIRNKAIEKKNIDCLRSFTEREKTKAREIFGVNIEDFIDKYSKPKDEDNAYEIANMFINICKLFPDKPWAI